MKKLEFIKELRSRLKGYPKDVVDNAVNYYSECIDDAVEDGHNEEEAVRALGSMDEIVRNTLKDVPLSKLVKNKVKPDHRLNAFEIIILIIGFPLWFPLLMTACAIFFAFYVVLWSLFIAFAATAFGLVAGGLVALIASFPAFGAGIGFGLMSLGAALLCIGIGMVLIACLPLLVKGVLAIGRGFLLGVKALFIRKGDNE